MKLTYSIEFEQSEQFLDLFILGVLTALRNKAISIEDSEGFIFKPSVAEFLKSNFNERLFELIMEGCEFENFEDLSILNQLDERIDGLIANLLNGIKKREGYGRLIEKEINLSSV